MPSIDYHAAYERQKKARAIAEDLLENRSSELYEANQSLRYAYNKLKDQEQQIIHQEKLAAIGQLAAGVAHEINNPTAYVKSNISALKGYGESLDQFFEGLDGLVKGFCQNQPGGTCSAESQALIKGVDDLKSSCDIPYVMSDMVEIVDECRDGVSRIEEIVRGLKDFSRADSQEPEIIRLKECIDNTIKLVYNQVKHVMNIECDVDESLFIKGSRGSLSQVFLNMIINASHAVSKDGWLKIGGFLKEDLIQLTFKDNGSGVSPEVKRKIFDPFFTTKGRSEGTGLGLSISASIIKSHGGSIDVASEQGVGTEFTISLPAFIID